MNYEKLTRLLKSIGKRCFINCYEIASKKRDSLTSEDLIRHDPDLEGILEKAQRTQLSCIRKIFKEGCAEQALRMATNTE